LDSSTKRSTAFIVGAGAVEGAWGPVCNALGEVYGEGFPGTSVAANTIFADIVWGLQWLYGVRRGERKPEHRARLDRECKRALAKYRRVKRHVAINLRKAEHAGEIRIRRQLIDLIAQHVGVSRCVLTTNWDTTLKGFLKQHYKIHPPVVHLHGTSADADSLFLPAEVIEAPYRKPWRVNRRLGGQALWTIDQISKCEELVVYGLSFDPLDAELGRVVAEGAKNLKKIVVVDLEPGVVVDRLKALLLPKRPLIEPREVERVGQRILRLSIDERVAGWAQSEADRRELALATVVTEALSTARDRGFRS
jgi:hypothetical protein